MLTFLGRGAMFLPEEGNTSAYFEEDNNLFLIDSGEDVAQKLISLGKLKKDINYYLFITHTHSDHVGSLGSLQQYLYYVCKTKINLVYSDDVHKDDIKKVMDAFKLHQDQYNLIQCSELNNKFQKFSSVKQVLSDHGDPTVHNYSIIFDTPKGSVLYTGDIKESKVITDFLDNYKKIYCIYTDCSYNESPVHISLNKLTEIIPPRLRRKVYCMHINNTELFDEVKKKGFNLVDVVDPFLIKFIDKLDEMDISELEELKERMINGPKEKIKRKRINVYDNDGKYHVFVFDIKNSRLIKDPDRNDKVIALFEEVHKKLEKIEKQENKTILHKPHSPYHDSDPRFAEPFVLCGDTFGFTILTGSMPTKEVYQIFEETKKELHIEYEFHIGDVTYHSDEIKLHNLWRMDAIDILTKNFKLQKDDKPVKRYFLY